VKSCRVLGLGLAVVVVVLGVPLLLWNRAASFLAALYVPFPLEFCTRNSSFLGVEKYYYLVYPLELCVLFSDEASNLYT